MLVVDQNVVVIRCEAKHQQTSTGLCQPNDQTFPRRAFVSPDGRDVAPNDSDEYASSRVLLAGFVGNALHQYTQEYHQSQLGLGSQTFIAGKDHLFSM
jgi:hypothetical protein